jgi:hypothetical protein
VKGYKCSECDEKVDYDFDATLCRKCGKVVHFDCYREHLRHCRTMGREVKEAVPSLLTGREYGVFVGDRAKLGLR